jgi:predicted CopG family antitoxin
LHKKLTITVDEDVYDGLHRVVGRQKISHFIEELVRPHVVQEDLMAAYRQMAEEEDREAEAQQRRAAVSERSLRDAQVQLGLAERARG